MINVGTIVNRSKDKREGRVVATKDIFTKNKKYQVKWVKGLTRWVEAKDFVAKP